jgi:predicted ATPase
VFGLVLERIEVEGFKSIDQLAVDLRPLTVLVGPNGAGKSNFIGVFELLGQIIDQRLELSVNVAGRVASPSNRMTCSASPPAD